MRGKMRALSALIAAGVIAASVIAAGLAVPFAARAQNYGRPGYAPNLPPAGAYAPSYGGPVYGAPPYGNPENQPGAYGRYPPGGAYGREGGQFAPGANMPYGEGMGGFVPYRRGDGGGEGEDDDD